MDFRSAFRGWLQSILSSPVPDEVQAFAFNLYEPAGVRGVRFGVELIGAERFDADDSEWVCDEVWEADPRGIDIPVDFSGPDWEPCLAKVRREIEAALETVGPVSATLKSRQAVAVGFVDGDLELVWSA